MSRSLQFVLCYLVLGAHGAHAEEPAAGYHHSIHVAPGGNDAFTGRSPLTVADDGPVATLDRAREIVRSMKAASGGLAQPVSVVLHEGTYFLDEPLVLDYRDGGTTDCPVTWRAAEGARVIVSGGVRIAGWQKAADGVWQTTLPESFGAHYPRQLFVNGRRAVRARTPNANAYHIIDGLVDADDPTSDSNKSGFRFPEGSIEPEWITEDTEVVILHRWDNSRLRVASADANQRAVRFVSPSRWPFRNDRRFWVENVRQALDAPGEWFFDRANGTVYYRPREDEDLRLAEVIMPRLDALVVIEGDSQTGRPVRFLNIEDLTFCHADWDLPREGFPGKQAAYDVPADIVVQGAEDCALVNCEMTHLGGNGILLGRGCRRVKIVGCHFHDLGGGAVLIGESYVKRPLDFTETCDNRVTDCTIHDTGQIYYGAVGIWVGEAAGNTIAHNEIFHTTYTAISVGWCWSFDPNRTRDNIIEYNHLHHLMNNVMSDGGGIYTLGVSPGTRLRNNVIHDVDAYSDHSGRGIYLDEGTMGVLVENNVVFRTSGPLMRFQIGTAGNIVVNNVFAFGQEAQLGFDTDRTNVFQRNIVYFDDGELFGRDDWQQYQQVIDWNCYYRADRQPISFLGDRSWDEWRQIRPAGCAYFQPPAFDRQSMVADPGFVDPEHGDFRIAGDSPARTVRFQPIDVSNVGPRGDHRIDDIERPRSAHCDSGFPGVASQ